MSSLIGSMTLWVAISSTGGIFFNRNPNQGVLPPQPGYGSASPTATPTVMAGSKSAISSR